MYVYFLIFYYIYMNRPILNLQVFVNIKEHILYIILSWLRWKENYKSHVTLWIHRIQALLSCSLIMKLFPGWILIWYFCHHDTSINIILLSTLHYYFLGHKLLFVIKSVSCLRDFMGNDIEILWTIRSYAYTH